MSKGIWPLLVLLLAACGRGSQEYQGPNALPVDTMRAKGWITLFDGRTLTGWHDYQQALGVTTGWTVDSGTIRTDGDAADLVSDQQYGSFELDLEWKVAPGANSGIFYWANEGTAHIYENAPEMQVLDNAGHPDGKSPLTAAGSLYDLYPAPISVAKPAGEWNQVRIVAHGSKVEQWLNGTRVVDVNFDSKEMRDRIAASKFKAWETFGKSHRGHIGLQSHGGTVWFRNIRIKDKDPE
ncbi:MAG: 3-keto-disaccharide hydrolase [Gemmatimonadales bacterium]